MLLVTTLIEERRHDHSPKEIIPLFEFIHLPHFRVTLSCKGGDHFTHCGDADNLVSAIQKAILAAKWRDLKVEAILFAGPVGD